MINSHSRKVNGFFRWLCSFALAGLLALTMLPAIGRTLAKSNAVGPDTDYVRYATGINIYGAPKDWYMLAPQYGYYLSETPVVGGVVSFRGGTYGTNSNYGFVALVVYYKELGDYWDLGTRYAYPKSDGVRYYNHFSAKEQTFRIRKHDPNVYYIYRRGENLRPAGYYFYPEYAGYDVVGKQNVLSSETKEVTVYPDTNSGTAYVGPGQVVRVLAKAEIGETMWVLVHTPYRKGSVYAKTYYNGKEQLTKFNAASPDARYMYYVQNYGDTVIDLGYADYSKIAGGAGQVKITIMKGGDPMKLQPLQTVTLQLATE
jgi:hypothetical protein